MEILLILLLPILWVLVSIINDSFQRDLMEKKEKKLEKQAKREMWRQERVDRWWNKEMELSLQIVL